MNTEFRHATVCWGLAILAQCGVSLASQATNSSDDKIQFAIPSEDLQTALNEFAFQSRKDVLFSPDIATTKRSKELIGNFDARTALEILLSGTGLNFTAADEHTILVGVASGGMSPNRIQKAAEEGLLLAQAVSGIWESDGEPSVRLYQARG